MIRLKNALAAAIVSSAVLCGPAFAHQDSGGGGYSGPGDPSAGNNPASQSNQPQGSDILGLVNNAFWGGGSLVTGQIPGNGNASVGGGNDHATGNNDCASCH